MTSDFVLSPDFNCSYNVCTMASFLEFSFDSAFVSFDDCSSRKVDFWKNFFESCKNLPWIGWLLMYC